MQAADAAGQVEPALRRSLLMSGLSPVDRQPSASEAASTVTVGFGRLVCLFWSHSTWCFT